MHRSHLFVLGIGALVALTCVWLVVHRRPDRATKGVPDLSQTSPLNQPGGAQIPSEDYEPYSALYQQQPPDDPLAFAADSYADIPQLNGNCLHPRTPEERDMADAFAGANRQSHSWQHLFTIPTGYQLLSSAEVRQVESCLDTHFQDDSHCARYTKIRHVRLLGIPGFDHSHTHALVSVAREFGTHRGTGGIFEVDKFPTGWRRADPSDFTRDCSWMY